MDPSGPFPMKFRQSPRTKRCAPAIGEAEGCNIYRRMPLFSTSGLPRSMVEPSTSEHRIREIRARISTALCDNHA